MNIANKGKKLGIFFAEYRFVAVLEKVSCAVVACSAYIHLFFSCQDFCTVSINIPYPTHTCSSPDFRTFCRVLSDCATPAFPWQPNNKHRINAEPIRIAFFRGMISPPFLELKMHIVCHIEF